MDENLVSLIKQGEEILASLSDATFSCLRNLESLSQEDVGNFLEQRQRNMEQLALFEGKLIALRSAHALTDEKSSPLLENFRRYFHSTLTGIIEADALIRALADSKMTTIRTQLGTVTQGHRAMQGYGGGRRTRAAMGRIA